MQPPKPGIYKHHKGGMYRVLSNALHSETQELMVVYQAIESDQVWVRPLDIWLSPVKSGARFEFVGQ